MSTVIRSEKITRTKNKIKGTFRLSDKSITKFECTRNGEWYQWGNIEENLFITVRRVEELHKEINAE